jgi:hypothetical protein
VHDALLLAEQRIRAAMIAAAVAEPPASAVASASAPAVTSSSSSSPPSSSAQQARDSTVSDALSELPVLSPRTAVQRAWATHKSNARNASLDDYASLYRGAPTERESRCGRIARHRNVRA